LDKIKAKLSMIAMLRRRQAKICLKSPDHSLVSAAR
jgi:hypothetical protein